MRPRSFSSEVIFVNLILRPPPSNYASGSIRVEKYYNNVVIFVSITHRPLPPNYISDSIGVEKYNNYVDNIILKFYTSVEYLENWQHILLTCKRRTFYVIAQTFLSLS